MSNHAKTEKEENLKEFLEFYNAVQSKRYFLSDPNAKPFTDTSKLNKSSSNIKLGKLEESTNRLYTPPQSKFAPPGKNNKLITQSDEAKPTMSQNSWIPDKLRIKQLTREGKTLDDSLDGFIRKNIRTQKKLQKLGKSDYDMAKLEESLGKSKYLCCGCCKIKYLAINLPFKVPNKAIMDTRKNWKQTFTSSEEKSSTKRDVFSDIKQMSRREASSLYDDSRVCVFCAQFFNNPEEYRPSYSQVVEEEKLERIMLQQKHDDLKWDPLALLEADRKMQQLMADMS